MISRGCVNNEMSCVYVCVCVCGGFGVLGGGGGGGGVCNTMLQTSVLKQKSKEMRPLPQMRRAVSRRRRIAFLSRRRSPPRIPLSFPLLGRRTNKALLNFPGKIICLQETHENWLLPKALVQWKRQTANKTSRLTIARDA